MIGSKLIHILVLLIVLRGGVGAAENGSANLTLEQFIQRVAEQNEAVQMRVLSFEASRQAYLAEKGIFEPEFFGSASKESLDRQNTVQETRNQLSPTFSEDNNIYQTGIEGLVPSGAKLRLGYTLRDLRNNLQDDPAYAPLGATNGEYQSFLGLTLTQPLLKNGWFNVNGAKIRIAALSSKIAFQEYRKQSMLVYSAAENTYWRLFFLQEQVRFLEQSVETAETILNDSRIKLDAGQGTELDVKEAEAGWALRSSLLAQARQKVREASNEMATLASERLGSRHDRIHALTRPGIIQQIPSLGKVYATAYRFNPDYSMQVEKAARDGITLGYLRNQRLPELNLRGSYGLNGLSDNPGSSWDDLATGDWPAWTVGLELRVPLSGGVQAKREFTAAQLKEQETLLGLRALETQLLNSLDSAVKRIEETRMTATNYQAQVALREAVLEAALSRLDVGKLESRRVLEIEADLLETKSAEVEALVNHRKALVDMYVLDGSLLSRWDLDFSQSDLEQATAAFVRPGGMSREQYAQLVRQAQNLQAAGATGLWPADWEQMQDMRSEVGRKMEALDRPEWDPSD